MKVYILIVNYNSWVNSLELVKSIEASTYRNYQIVVIDNCSTDESYQQLSKLSNLKLIQTDKNGGFAYANNFFINQIKQEHAYVWMLNPDTLIKKDTLERLVLSASNKQTTILTTTILDAEDNQKKQRSGLCKINKLLGITSHIFEPNKAVQADYIYGASLFCHANAFNEIGLFPEHYFLYWEETEWCIVAKKKGYEFYWCQEAIIYDKVSSLDKGKQFVSEYYYTFNALRFFKQFYPGYLPLILCLNVPRSIYRLIQGSTFRTKAIIKATIDFLVGKSTSLPSQIN